MSSDNDSKGWLEGIRSDVARQRLYQAEMRLRELRRITEMIKTELPGAIQQFKEAKQAVAATAPGGPA